MLEARLKEKLPHSELRDTLFEFLVTRRELLKERMVKEPDAATQGRAKELSELIELFAPRVNGNE